MFTQCPECLTVQAITPEQLRVSKGMLRCSQCAAFFDGLERISETADIAPPERQATTDLPWEQAAPARTQYWLGGFVLGLGLLFWQIYYFEGYALGQNPKLRPYLLGLCAHIACQLPDYQNTAEFTVLHGSFTATPERYYVFKLAFVNQADFAQAYPKVTLSLLDYNGNTFAYRTFKPKDYLPTGMTSGFMSAAASTEMTLKIAPPKASIGGSRFDLSF